MYSIKKKNLPSLDYCTKSTCVSSSGIFLKEHETLPQFIRQWPLNLIRLSFYFFFFIIPVPTSHELLTELNDLNLHQAIFLATTLVQRSINGKKTPANKKQTKTPKHQTPKITQNILGLYSLFLKTIWSFKIKYSFVFCVNWNIITERNQTKHIATT